MGPNDKIGAREEEAAGELRPTHACRAVKAPPQIAALMPPSPSTRFARAVSCRQSLALRAPRHPFGKTLLRLTAALSINRERDREVSKEIRCSVTANSRGRACCDHVTMGAKLPGQGAEVPATGREKSREALLFRAVSRLGEAFVSVALLRSDPYARGNVCSHA